MYIVLDKFSEYRYIYISKNILIEMVESFQCILNFDQISLLLLVVPLAVNITISQLKVESTKLKKITRNDRLRV